MCLWVSCLYEWVFFVDSLEDSIMRVFCMCQGE